MKVTRMGLRKEPTISIILNEKEATALKETAGFSVGEGYPHPEFAQDLEHELEAALKEGKK